MLCMHQHLLLFLWLNKILMYAHIILLFIHLQADRPLGCFHFLAVMNNVALLTCGFLCEDIFSILLCIFV